MKTSLRRYVGWFWREWLRPLALAAAIVFPLKSAVADWNYVPSGSMIPSILPGELVWIKPETQRLAQAVEAALLVPEGVRELEL